MTGSILLLRFHYILRFSTILPFREGVKRTFFDEVINGRSLTQIVCFTWMTSIETCNEVYVWIHCFKRFHEPIVRNHTSSPLVTRTKHLISSIILIWLKLIFFVGSYENIYFIAPIVVFGRTMATVMHPHHLVILCRSKCLIRSTPSFTRNNTISRYQISIKYFWKIWNSKPKIWQSF